MFHKVVHAHTRDGEQPTNHNWTCAQTDHLGATALDHEYHNEHGNSNRNMPMNGQVHRNPFDGAKDGNDWCDAAIASDESATQHGQEYDNAFRSSGQRHTISLCGQEDPLHQRESASLAVVADAQHNADILDEDYPRQRPEDHTEGVNNISGSRVSFMEGVHEDPSEGVKG
jgi:hypothetical protein